MLVSLSLFASVSPFSGESAEGASVGAAEGTADYSIRTGPEESSGIEASAALRAFQAISTVNAPRDTWG